MVQRIDAQRRICLMPQKRRIIHIDMNSFFASVEQQANPFLRNRSLGVSSGITDYNTILAASYEAKAKGIRTGTKNYIAKELDPKIIIIPISHNKYFDYSNKLIEIFKKYSPIVEAYSVDEAFLDMSGLTKNYEELKNISLMIKKEINRELGESIRCSIGISTNKLLSKIGSDFKKPDGLTIIEFEKRFDFLDKLKIPDVWGFGYHISTKLELMGIKNIQELRMLNTGTLRDLFGGYYIKLQLILNGEDYSLVKNTELTEKDYLPQSMQHAHMIGKPETNKQLLLELIRKLSEKIALRLRRYDLKSHVIAIYLNDINLGKLSNYTHFEIATNLGKDIFESAKEYVNGIYGYTHPHAKSVCIEALKLYKDTNLNIFPTDKETEREERITDAIDKVNDKWGSFTIKSADILNNKTKESKFSVEHPHLIFHA